MTGSVAPEQVRDAGSTPRPLAPIDHVDPIVQRILPALRRMVASEVEKIAPPPVPRVVMATPDHEIMAACRKVAEASDRLEQVKYSREEIRARQALERAAQSLQRVMRKHGRLG